MELQKILDIFEEHGFNENNCSFFRQEDITDIAKELITAINYNQCCMGEAEQLQAYVKWKETTDIDLGAYTEKEQLGLYFNSL